MSLANAARRRPADLLLAAEALALLTAFRIALAIIPVKTILRAITRNRRAASDQPPAQLPNPVPEAVLRVRWAIEAVARNSPIAFVCFPQTLAGYTMLRRRHIPTTMVYGVARSPSGELIAHTWLTIGDRTLLGGEGAGAFSPVERWF
jgi:Transglutaminase-like superfamily